MNINLSIIIGALGNKIELIKDGIFNSLSLTNGALKKDNLLLTYIESEKYINDIINNREIACIICKDEILEQVKGVFDGGIVASKNPREDFFMFHNYLNRNSDFYKNEYNTVIEENAHIDLTAKISSKNVKIGKNTKIMANVVIYENTIIGDNVIIREGSVLGSPAFYYFSYNGNNETVDSVGGVKLQDNVEIYPNTVICKGTLGGDTEIGKHTKLDSNVFIAHDVKIMENCLITAGSVLAGVVTVKNNCFIGVGANIVPLVTIGENCKISAGAVVTRNVPDNSQVSGNFAISHTKFIEHIKSIS